MHACLAYAKIARKKAGKGNRNIAFRETAGFVREPNGEGNRQRHNNARRATTHPKRPTRAHTGGNAQEASPGSAPCPASDAMRPSLSNCIRRRNVGLGRCMEWLVPWSSDSTTTCFSILT